MSTRPASAPTTALTALIEAAVSRLPAAPVEAAPIGPVGFGLG